MVMMMRRLSFVWLLLTRCSFRSISTTTAPCLLIHVARFAIVSSGGGDDGRSSSGGAATAKAVATTSTTLSTGDANLHTKYFTNNQVQFPKNR